MQARNWGTKGHKTSVSFFFFWVLFLCANTQVSSFLPVHTSCVHHCTTTDWPFQNSAWGRWSGSLCCCRTPEMARHSACMSCWDGFLLREHPERGFPLQQKPLLCGNAVGKSWFPVSLLQYVWPTALLWLSWWVSQQEEKPTSPRSWHAT